MEEHLKTFIFLHRKERGKKTDKRGRMCQCTVYFHSMAGRHGVRTVLSSDSPRVGWGMSPFVPSQSFPLKPLHFAAID